MKDLSRLSRLKIMWMDKSISLPSKHYRCGSSSCLPSFMPVRAGLYRGTWKKDPILKMRLYRRLMHISFKGHLTNEPRHDKTNKMSMHLAKTQISLDIRQVWSESSLCVHWTAKDPRFLHADIEDWPDWADAQADLSLRCAHMPFCWVCRVAAQM